MSKRKQSTIFPDLSALDLDSFFPVYDQGSDAHIDPQTQQAVTFDFSKSYSQDVLFHEQCGSGCSWNVFERLVLAPKAKNEILGCLKRLPPRFNAIHIRNTDLKTAYVDQLISLYPNLISSALPVLLCSDNHQVLKHAQGLLQGIHVFSIYDYPSDLRSDGYSSLHYNSSTRGWRGDIGLLSDLFALALSEQLFVLRLANGNFSGFSLLAQDLHRRPWILNRLFGSQVDVLRKK